jgi:hypothetical protein
MGPVETSGLPAPRTASKTLQLQRGDSCMYYNNRRKCIALWPRCDNIALNGLVLPCQPVPLRLSV